MRLEITVFGAIAVFVIAMTLFFSVPAFMSSLENRGEAPDFTGISGWINSGPVSLGDLRGKVVLVDFWTYSCINCIRTIPYLNEWNDKYSSDGLVIVGVHTPEFEFEKEYRNVLSAVEKYGINYTVAQDNSYDTWNAYGNSFWPRKYLIDREGNIRYDHIGEGAYGETEEVIQELLREIKLFVPSGTVNRTQGSDYSLVGTPELYFGYEFARAPLGNPEGFSPGSVVDYAPINLTAGNIIYMSGRWLNLADRMVAVNNSAIALVYQARDVNIVAGGSAAIRVFVDGEPASGGDVVDGTGTVNGHRLYNAVAGSEYNVRVLVIEAEPGFEIYTFTFG